MDDAVVEVIVKLVSNPKFAAMMQEKINSKVDTAAIDGELADYEKQLRQFYSVKSKLTEEIDSLDPDDRHYIKRKADLDDRFYRMYDKIEDVETRLIETRAKKQAVEAEKMTEDNIYKVLIYFEKLYAVMNDVERRQFMETLLSEIQIYDDSQPNGQWVKFIKFKLPIIEEDMEMSGFWKDATYQEIKDYVKEQTGLSVRNLYIAQIKRKCGLDVGLNYNLSKKENAKVPHCPPEKE